MEHLLDAWMGMAVGIRGNRILKDFSFNEMIICRMLYRAEQEKRDVVATDICRQCRLLKSQVNKLLNDMEKKGVIEKQRDPDDKRRILISLSRKNRQVYLEEHARVMKIIGEICKRLSKEEVDFLAEEMSKVVEIMDEVSEK